MSEKLIGSCIFGQSGGPTAVINASAYGVIRAALDAEEITAVYGAAHGIRGVLDDKLYVMDEEDPAELKLLLNTLLGFLALWAVNLTAAWTGIALGLNLLNALVIGILGLPGFVLLLLVQWVL